MDLCQNFLIESIDQPVCFIPIPCSFYYYSSIVEFEVRDGATIRSSFIVQDCFSYPGYFVSSYGSDYCSFDVCVYLCWDFDGDCIEPVDCFW